MIMEKILITTKKKKEVIDITEDVEELLRDLGLKDGLCYLFVIHTTAAITTAEVNLSLDQDMLDAFDAMIPKLDWRHEHDPEHTPDHILSAMIGPSITIPVEGGLLQLGSYQRIVLIEFNGPRNRDVMLSFSLESK